MNEEISVCHGFRPAVVARDVAVHVCGVGGLGRFAEAPPSHVVSIWDGDSYGENACREKVRAMFPAAEVIFSYFDDVEFFAQASPSEAAVRRILDFTGRVPPGSSLLIHCRMGISRSSAIAFPALCQRIGVDRASDCRRALLQARPEAAPNRLIIALADIVLGAKGALMRIFCSDVRGVSAPRMLCRTCWKPLETEPAYYDILIPHWIRVCEKCFPSYHLQEGYGHCLRQADGTRIWNWR